MQFSSFQPSGLVGLQGFSDTYAGTRKLSQERDKAKADQAAQDKSLELAERRVRVDEQREARAAEQRDIASQQQAVAEAQARAEAVANGELTETGFESREMTRAIDHLGKIAEYLPGEHLPGVFNMFRDNARAVETKREKAEARHSANNMHANGVLDDEALEGILEEIEEAEAPGEAKEKLRRVNAAASSEAVRAKEIEGHLQSFNSMLSVPSVIGTLGSTEMGMLNQLLVAYENDPSMDPSEFVEKFSREFHSAIARSNKERRAKEKDRVYRNENSGVLGAPLPGEEGEKQNAGPAPAEWNELGALRTRGAAAEQIAEWLNERDLTPADIPLGVAQGMGQNRLREYNEEIERLRLQMEALDQ